MQPEAVRIAHISRPIIEGFPHTFLLKRMYSHLSITPIVVLYICIFHFFKAIFAPFIDITIGFYTLLCENNNIILMNPMLML
jgi:hypothetical protein